jgi:hypothetical protein
MNDGSTSPAAQYTGSYGTVIEYTMPTKAGSAFVGWKVSGTDDTTATMFPTYPATDTSYAAVWNANKVNLTFNPMGGTFKSAARPASAPARRAATSPHPQIPPAPAIQFDGWCTERGLHRGGSGRYYIAHGLQHGVLRQMDAGQHQSDAGRQ